MRTRQILNENRPHWNAQVRRSSDFGTIFRCGLRQTSVCAVCLAVTKLNEIIKMSTDLTSSVVYDLTFARWNPFHWNIARTHVATIQFRRLMQFNYRRRSQSINYRNQCGYNCSCTARRIHQRPPDTQIGAAGRRISSFAATMRR